MESVEANDDRNLVASILNGDLKAFELFMKKYKRLVSHIVFKMVPQVDEREDICQDVFLRIYRNLHNFRYSSKLSTWVASITYNNCVNYLQKKKEPLFDDILPNETNPEIAEISDSLPVDEVEKIDIRERLQTEIEKLPKIYRIILTLYHLDEMSYNEIVEITHLPEGTVKSHLFRARRMLKERLMKKYRQEDLCP